jgi:hypothetical protein
LIQLLQQISVTLRCEVQIGVARFLRLFPEAVQHVGSVVELRHVQHSECSRSVANPNFAYPSADRIHWLLVVWLAPTLDLVELISRLTPGRLRKRAQILKRTASELDGFGIDH